MEGFWYYCAPLTIWGVCKNNATFKMSQASFHFSDYLSFCGIIWGPMSTSVTTNISSNKIRKSVKLPIMWFFLFYNFKRWCSSICWEIWFQGLWINDTVTSRKYIHIYDVFESEKYRSWGETKLWGEVCGLISPFHRCLGASTIGFLSQTKFHGLLVELCPRFTRLEIFICFLKYFLSL